MCRKSLPTSQRVRRNWRETEFQICKPTALTSKSLGLLSRNSCPRVAAGRKKASWQSCLFRHVWRIRRLEPISLNGREN
ncbi:unnamed protein product [Ectocarpus sp. 13 AM-2016]